MLVTKRSDRALSYNYDYDNNQPTPYDMFVEAKKRNTAIQQTPSSRNYDSFVARRDRKDKKESIRLRRALYGTNTRVDQVREETRRARTNAQNLRVNPEDYSPPLSLGFNQYPYSNDYSKPFINYQLNTQPATENQTLYRFAPSENNYNYPKASDYSVSNNISYQNDARKAMATKRLFQSEAMDTSATKVTPYSNRAVDASSLDIGRLGLETERRIVNQPEQAPQPNCTFTEKAVSDEPRMNINFFGTNATTLSPTDMMTPRYYDIKRSESNMPDIGRYYEYKDYLYDQLSHCDPAVILSEAEFNQLKSLSKHGEVPDDKIFNRRNVTKTNRSNIDTDQGEPRARRISKNGMIFIAVYVLIVLIIASIIIVVNKKTTNANATDAKSANTSNGIVSLNVDEDEVDQENNWFDKIADGISNG
ncbi:MAG: hypothetical protein LBU04_08140 [Christensenellaceae bacterium]|jgi:hypothetical protein|nr:hypothetical protein [Christensenellaceae bacterium]